MFPAGSAKRHSHAGRRSDARDCAACPCHGVEQPPLEEGILVLGVADVLFHDTCFLTPLILRSSAPVAVKIEYIFGLRPTKLGDRLPSALILHFPKRLVRCAVEQAVLGIVVGVILISVVCHVGVHVLSLDLQLKAVHVGVNELCTVTILHLEMVVIPVMHEVL